MKMLLAVLLLGAAAIAQTNAALQSACGPVDTNFKVKRNASAKAITQTDPGKALVYVIEDQKFKGVRDVTARVGLDGNWIGADRGNSYLSFAVSPGEHHLCTDWVSEFLPAGRSVSLSSLNAEAGKVYYFRARTTGGQGSALTNTGGLAIADNGAIDLQQVDPDEGKMLIASSAMSVSHPKK